ncbi:hypothetical protein TNCV_117951 [Trichonephila clavipes]|nr:hypothetical protein TNCV_117951 [Trichonephila clavipes]
MTENDAPESTRARIGFLSIITSSWLPVILAVDGGFPVHAASPPGRSLSLVFLAPTAWRLTGSAIWRRGSVTTYWGSALVGLGVKRREEFGRRISSSVPTSSKFRRRFRGELSKTAFSLGSSALHVQDVRSGNKQVCCQPFSTHLFFLVQVGISEQELCISWLQRRMLVVV